MSETEFHIDPSPVASQPPFSHSRLSAILPLFCVALWLSSLLLFAIQPMFTKMILPLMGGTPAVWNTAVMFFQAMLLIGYLYAHFLSRLKALRWQVLVHAAVLTIGVLFLPVRIAWQQTATASLHPVPWLIGLLTVSIGLPFFAISATAPLLQRWFSRSDHPHASDPYFLYVSSNLGGLIALLAYPVLIEPRLGLAAQGRVWMAGYVLLAVNVVLCSVSLWAAHRRQKPTDCTTGTPPTPRESNVSDGIGWGRRARWVALAFVPSALLLAVTQHISTDLAAVPFLWVMPLALYLLSFIIVFARRPVLKHRWMLWGQVGIYALLAIYFTENDLWLLLTLHLLTLFVTAMVCHGELVRRRPAVMHLTEFYLWMSVGGFLGGVFCSLIAPIVFDSVLEYPLILTLACLLRPASRRGGLQRRMYDFALPTALILLYLLVSECLDVSAIGVTGPILFYGAVTLVLYSFQNRPLRFALGFAVILFTAVHADDMKRQIYRERSFFGVHTVCVDASGHEHKLYNGNILHGNQYMDPRDLDIPTTYYSRLGPLGQVFDAIAAVRNLDHVGVIGLGAGTTACYHQPGRTMTFFEVDPVIERIARDPKLFRYLEIAGPDVKVVIGDGRLSLANVPDGTFDLLVLDAFSSDAIPVHMLTREALALYVRKLAPGGIALLHISNRYLDLEPVVANLAEDADLPALIQDYDPTQEDLQMGGSASTWAAVARDLSDLGPLAWDDRWRTLEPDPAVGVWTDDYSNIFRTLIRGRLFRLD